VVPVTPAAGRAPTAQELDGFAVAVQRYDEANARHRGCLDQVLRHAATPEADRQRALTASNAAAEASNAAWDAYDQATQRFRDDQAARARATPPSMPPQLPAAGAANPPPAAR
jgi:hypothetical protein